MKKFGVFCLVALSLTLLCGNVWAQATASASLTGTVVDTSKAVVPNAEVTISNKDTGLTRTMKTTSTGLYRFDLLPAGNYEVKVTMAGFATVTVASTELVVGQTSTVNVTLQPGSVSQTVTVTEQAPMVDVTKTNVGMEVTQQTIQNMPLNGRDFGNLAYLAPARGPSTPTIPPRTASRSSPLTVRTAATSTSRSTELMTKTTL